MWIIYALSAAVLWGMSYAASGRVIERGIAPLSLFVCYGAFSAVAGALALLFTGRLSGLNREFASLSGEWIWFLIAVVGAAAGSLLIYLAIGEKNATIASLIEISYPLFVAFFAWLFFRETQLNWPTVTGGLLILCGVGIVFMGNKH
jgi:drug/metabolite transporter (DMT)-like permease